jgi:hypothetical protein
MEKFEQEFLNEPFAESAKLETTLHARFGSGEQTA